MDSFFQLYRIVSRFNTAYTHEEITYKLNLGNAFYHSVQNLLYSSLLSESIRIKYAELQYCLLFFMGVKLGLYLRKKYARRLLENRVLRKMIFLRGTM
jgi:hypothetical protein